MDTWGHLPGTSGDAWERMCGTTGDAWERLEPHNSDTWERLTTACSQTEVVKDAPITKGVRGYFEECGYVSSPVLGKCKGLRRKVRAHAVWDEVRQ